MITNININGRDYTPQQASKLGYTLGRHLRQLRESLGISRQQAADRLGYKKWQVQSVEQQINSKYTAGYVARACSAIFQEVAGASVGTDRITRYLRDHAYDFAPHSLTVEADWGLDAHILWGLDAEALDVLGAVGTVSDCEIAQLWLGPDISTCSIKLKLTDIEVAAAHKGKAHGGSWMAASVYDLHWADFGDMVDGHKAQPLAGYLADFRLRTSNTK